MFHLLYSVPTINDPLESEIASGSSSQFRVKDYKAWSCDLSERTSSRTTSVCDRPVVSAYFFKISISLWGNRQFKTVSDLSLPILTRSDACTTMIINLASSNGKTPVRAGAFGPIHSFHNPHKRVLSL